MAKQSYPEPTVGLFIVNPKDELLLIHSPKWRGFWTLPGGHIEKGESWKAAATREAKEEVGLAVEPKEIFFVQEAISPENFHKKDSHFIFLEVLCRVSGGTVDLDGREAVDFVWASPKEALKEMNIEKYTAETIRAYLGNCKCGH